MAIRFTRAKIRSRGPVLKITRAERAANRRLRERLIEAFEPIFEEIVRQYRLDTVAELRRQVATGAAIGIPVNASRAFEAALQVGLSDLLRDAIARGARLGLRNSEAIPGISMDPAAITEFAREYVERVGANRITGTIATADRAAIREIVRDVLASDYSSTEAARRIGQRVGLTTRQARTLELFEQALVRQRIPTPEANTQLARESINQDVERRRETLVRQRANLIAEVEAQDGIQEGQRAFWEQAIERGEVESDALLKRWFTVRDGRECPICEPLHRQVRPFSQDFVSPAGWSGPRPLAHPRCRCDVDYGTPAQLAD